MAMRTERVRGMMVQSAAKADAPKTTEAKKTAKAPAAKAGDVVEIKKKEGTKEPRTVVFPPPTEQWMPPAKATVLTEDKSVYDGDTCKIPGYSIRLNGGNAPERRPAEEGWEYAQQRFEKLVKGKEIDLTYDREDPRDGYGRLVANISVGGKNVVKELVSQGAMHAYFVGNDATVDRADIVAAQAAAKKAKLGIWAQDRFKEQFTLTSFHPNGRGSDIDNPNVEYFRICNIADQPVDIGGWTVKNAKGTTWKLPSVEVPVGQTVQIFSGEGVSTVSPPDEIKVYLGSKKPIWDNFEDKLQLKDKKGHVVVEREQMQPEQNLEKLKDLDVITQKQIGALGADTSVVYSGPAKIGVKQYIMDDGDTIFIPRPKDGTFKATIAGRYTLPLQISGNDETPDGKLGIRFIGVDTPETRVRKTLDSGELVYASQGLPGVAAKEALEKMFANAAKIEIVPPKGRPFDYYDRLLGTVMVTPKGETKAIDVNAWLIEQGHGEMLQYWQSDFDMDRFNAMSAKSKAAVDGKRGIYGDGEARLLERPADFRRRMANRPPSGDFVIDMETKLVYPHTHIEAIPPYRRCYILTNQLDMALRDKKMGLKLAPMSAKEAADNDVASPSIKAAKGSVRAPAAKAMRALDLRISEKKKQA